MPQALRFELDNLHCASCVARAEAALGAIPGAVQARVNLATHSAQVEGVSAALVADALREAGYPAREELIVYDVAKMSCASCVARIEAAALAQPGVIRAEARLADKRLLVTALGHDGGIFQAALAEAGYPAIPHELDTAQTSEHGITDLRRRFIIALVLTLPVFVAEMGGNVFPALHHWIARAVGMQVNHSIQMVLTALVLAGPGLGFFARGVPALFKRRPDMDTLVAVGAGAAFFFSCVSVIRPQLLPDGAAAVYFEAAAVIVTLILLGRWLEARAKAQAGDAVRRLLTLAPDMATRVCDGVEEEVPVAAIVVGDLLRLRPGGRVAVDGSVEAGESNVDESMLTGEPVPVFKKSGDILSAGTLNGPGALMYRAQAVGDTTQLARIAKLTEKAQATRLPVEALVNRIASVFVPIVLVIALATFAIWLLAGAEFGPALVAAVSVLIIACPCAMGLATPMSVLVGTGRAAEKGVLFQGGDALQRLQDVAVVAFDKTGTLTQGKPRLVDLSCAPGVTRREALALAASVEVQSEHPLARAVIKATEEDGLTPVALDAFSAHPGEGATARLGAHDLALGNARLMERLGIVSADWPVLQPDQTAIYLARDGQMIARLAMADTLRADAQEIVAVLAGQGRHTALLSGDRSDVAVHVAELAGVAQSEGGLLPAGKVERIEALRRTHGPVAFVGDGINDAPALSAADVGLAVGTANDAALGAADVVLVASGLTPVTRAFDISRATLRNIRQNLVWAFAYNVLLIPVAAGILVPFGGPTLSPMLAAGAMALSSVMVVGNALRLRRA